MSSDPLGRRALVTLLALNGGMFVVEVVTGWRAESMGLIAGSAPEPPTMVWVSLVALLHSAIPDLVIGLVVCWLVFRGAIRIGRRVRAAESAT